MVFSDSDGNAMGFTFWWLGCPDDSACNYYATATDSGGCIHIDAICETCVNGEIVDKKEHYTCNEEEEDNFFVKFLTDPKYETSFITLVAILLENL